MRSRIALHDPRFMAARRSPASAIGRSASTHLRTSTPLVRLELRGLHLETSISKDGRTRRTFVQVMRPVEGQSQGQDEQRLTAGCLRLRSTKVRGRSFAPNRPVPDTLCRAARSEGSRDASIVMTSAPAS